MHFHRFDEPGRVKLDQISPEGPQSVKKSEARARYDELNEELFALQDLLWGARTHSVLIVLQGRDAAGKDGAIKHMSGGLNPRGVVVTSFGVPTVEERQRDFLWRVHKQTPRAGEFALFNRSHYEDVLVVRVRKLAPREVWKERYGLINTFERTLVTAGTIVLKYFLHISKEEQEERRLGREKNTSRASRHSVDDLRRRQL